MQSKKKKKNKNKGQVCSENYSVQDCATDIPNLLLMKCDTNAKRENK